MNGRRALRSESERPTHSLRLGGCFRMRSTQRGLAIGSTRQPASDQLVYPEQDRLTNRYHLLLRKSTGNALLRREKKGNEKDTRVDDRRSKPPKEQRVARRRGRGTTRQEVGSATIVVKVLHFAHHDAGASERTEALSATRGRCPSAAPGS